MNSCFSTFSSHAHDEHGSESTAILDESDQNLHVFRLTVRHAGPVHVIKTLFASNFQVSVRFYNSFHIDCTIANLQVLALLLTLGDFECMVLNKFHVADG